MRGKAAPADLRSDVDGDHPRTCGEKAMYEYGNNTAEGSPPHMRGKDAPWRAHSPFLRITPAHAGKRCQHRGFAPVPLDHPRTCGEKIVCRGCLSCVEGSPPRMRGKVWSLMFHDFAIRITPAYAGKRRPQNADQRQSGDHPRVCGEKLCIRFLLCTQMGSPPRMRGKAAGASARVAEKGITPAYAGKR